MQIKLTQQELFQLVSHFEEIPGTIFLYSGGAGPAYLALFPTAIIHVTDSTPWETLQKSLPALSGDAGPEWFGYFNYEMGAFSDADTPIDSPFHPEAYLQKPSVLLEWDPHSGMAHIKGDTSKGDWEQLSKAPAAKAWKAPGPVRALETKESYIAKIRTIQEKIAAGEVYQVNLSQAFHVENFEEPYFFFCRLMEINPVPFAAYIRLQGKVIISASPERLLASRRGILETNPIKGTAPRGKTEEEDFLLKEELLNSEKNQAELLMIVDLMRNDLGKISVPGTVQTPRIFHLKTYPHLHHTLATVIARPLPHLSPVDQLRNCFPGGSVSGCPKLSALQLILDLEKRARKSYTGSIGYICGNGDFDWNIAIRTVEVEHGKALVQLGGAIVYDSDPEQEYQETLVKGKTLFEAMGLG